MYHEAVLLRVHLAYKRLFRERGYPVNRLLRINLAILILSMLPACLLAQSEVVNTVAGNGEFGFSLADGIAISMTLKNPRGVSVDALGNFYFADSLNHRIRKVLPDGTSVSVAGRGAAGSSGDGGPATTAYLDSPNNTAMDALGNLYIAEKDSHRIRKVNSAGVITRFAGTSVPGFNGDGIAAASAMLNEPLAIAVDRAGNLYIADSGNNRIRKVTVTGTISTVAGNGTAGYSGDGGQATLASLKSPQGVTVDSAGNIFIADYANYRVRMVNSEGIISTVAGTGAFGFSGDGGLATAAQLNFPQSVATDAAGNLYIADYGNNRIRKVTPDGIINTIIGTNILGFSGDGGAASEAEIFHPMDLAVDEDGNLYFSDYGNLRIRKISRLGSDTTYFPQIAIGGGFTTYFTITNTGSTTATGELKFSNSEGEPLDADGTRDDGTGFSVFGRESSIAFVVPSGGVAFIMITSESEGSIQTGWARLVSEGGSLTTVAAYEFLSESSVNKIVGVSESSRIRFATIAVDNDSSTERQTAYALVNPSGMTINVRLALVNMDGTIFSDALTLPLGPGEYRAGYLYEILNCSNFRGSVVLRGQNSATFVVMSLLDKGGLFTSMPIISGKAPVVPD
jgi:sugar lactone lactonase YvrE